MRKMDLQQQAVSINQDNSLPKGSNLLLIISSYLQDAGRRGTMSASDHEIPSQNLGTADPRNVQTFWRSGT